MINRTLLLTLTLSAACFAQVQVRTRTVLEFGALEKKLATAEDSATRASLLTDDFEERLCAEPGTPVPRDQWLTEAATHLSLSQEAVHDYGDTSVYSALGIDGDKHLALVDVWKKQGNDWKLAVRYLCPATGKQPKSSIPKRY